VISILEFLIDNICIWFGGTLFQHVVGIPMILNLKSSRLSYILVLGWPLSSNSRDTSKNDADLAVSVVSITSSSGGYINGKYSANLELLIDKTLSIYLFVKLKALASWIFLCFKSFWRNYGSYEYTNKSARRGTQFVPIGIPTYPSNLTTMVNPVLKCMINGTTSNLKS
jgi:hypothetical protein